MRDGDIDSRSLFLTTGGFAEERAGQHRGDVRVVERSFLEGLAWGSRGGFSYGHACLPWVMVICARFLCRCEW